MKLYSLDFETYYAPDYSLSKMTTEAYVRDPRFEPILLGYQVDDSEPGFVSGRASIQTLLDAMDIENNAVLCHHAHFDGLILSHQFGHRPKVWFDTLSMGRAHHGIDVGGSLKKLLEHYPDAPVQKDTTELVNAYGKRYADFTPQELFAYAKYCMDDVRGTRFLLMKMLPHFGKGELKQIDRIIRMFTEPTLQLDEQWLRDYALEIQANKLTLLFEAGVTLDEVMSNEKFAQALIRAGVQPPMKVSPTNPEKRTYAFAKTDKKLQELAEHDDHTVQALVAARLGNKSTINETRAIRMADMAARGPAALYYKYAGAMQTMRVSGGDKMNWQNLQRVKKDKETGALVAGHLRYALYAPEGHLIVVCDSSNIESRTDDWLACQDDMLEVYRKNDRGEGPDVYCVMASKLYEREITASDTVERQAGKVIKLGCGYGMGAQTFRETARIMAGLTLTPQEAEAAVAAYRRVHPMVQQLWNRAGTALPLLASGPDGEHDKYIDPRGLLLIEKGAIVLPNKLRIKYPGLSYNKTGDMEYGPGWSFITRRGRDGAVIERGYIYGGKIVENAVQALARIIVMDQTGEVSRKFPYAKEVMTTHDEGVWVVPEDKAEEVLAFAQQAMSQTPSWAPGLPVSAKGDIAVRYGDAK